MQTEIATALISGGSSMLVAITALVLNYRGFASIDSRFASLEGRMLRLEQRMDTFQHDLTEFYKAQMDLDKRVTRLEDRDGQA